MNNSVQAKRLNIIAYVLSAVVLGLVVAMRYIKLDFGIDFHFLPPLHAGLNAITAVILLFAFIAIKQKRIKLHRNLIMAAFVCSTLFLISYVLYHTTSEPTLYGGEGVMRYIYFFFLITHVVLAAVIFPFILFTFIRAYTNQIERHKKMARWVFPIWFYVALTGPICYLLLKPYY